MHVWSCGTHMIYVYILCLYLQHRPIIYLSPSVWENQSSCQGDKLVITQLITIISPSPEPLQFMYVLATHVN